MWSQHGLAWLQVALAQLGTCACMEAEAGDPCSLGLLSACVGHRRETTGL